MILYMITLWLWPMCYGFVLLSSAAAGSKTDVTFSPGQTWTYDLLTTVLLNEPAAKAKDVGFQITARIKVESVWRNPSNSADRLLQFQLIEPHLHVKSRKAPTPEDFLQHSSELDTLSNGLFLVHWRHGRVQSIYLPLNEPLSIANLKKGVASLFQFQVLDLDTNETDASGRCQVFYTSTSPTSFTKEKKSCRSDDTPFMYHSNRLFSIDLNSIRKANYKMSPNLEYIEAIQQFESHVMTLRMKQETGNRLEIKQKLHYLETGTIDIIESERIENAIEQITNQIDFTQETLITERETKPCPDSGCPTFGKTLADNLKVFEPKNYGKVKTATVFNKVLNLARQATKDDIIKVLKKKQNKSILTAIYDILGTAQTLEAHEAVMKQLRFTDEKHFDQIETYLWALSLGSHPKLDIIKDLVKRFLRTNDINEKLKETLILTICAMTEKYEQKPENLEREKIMKTVLEIIYNGIENCDQKTCQYQYIRGLKNLKSMETIPKLIELALNGADRSSVIVMKALRSFPSKFWTKEVLKACHSIFYQLKKKYDSSARTLAFNILIESDPKPKEQTIRDILTYLLSADKSYEVKKYAIQKLIMSAQLKPEFGRVLKKVLAEEKRVNNYVVWNQRGMSTVLIRQFLNHPALNGSMISAQEMNVGLVKRGVFDIVLENEEQTSEIFSLGLFSGGLSSFLSSDEEEIASDDDVATAGMELSILGTQIRPFVFFSGQGELMGHVWSGTASESTPAFQINTLVHDHVEYIRLSPGFLVEVQMQTGLSFNLAGEIQISLWNRNSHSLVNENAAVFMNGLLRIDTSFVHSKIEFTITMDPKLDLESNVEFGSGVAVCFKLKQPSIIFKHTISKVERVPGSKYRLGKTKQKQFEIPGRTYNLNQKNNDMCNLLSKNR